MKRLRFLAALAGCLLLAVVVSCSGLFNPASRLYGTWVLDVDATVERAAPDNQLRQNLLRTSWALIGGDVAMTFQSDGTASYKGSSLFGSASQSGTWKVNSAEGDVLQVEITPDSAQSPSSVEVRFLTEDTLEIDSTTGQVQVLIFRRDAK